MNEIFIDTEKMREKGQDILAQVEELKAIIETMFNRIKNIPNSTLEWQGDSADNFIAYAEQDKLQYINYAKDLYEYGKYLIDCAEYIEKQIKGDLKYE